MGWILHENGNYYQTSDDAGTLDNILYNEGRSDAPGALNVQRATGNMVDDLDNKVGTVYTINKGYGEDITGARLSRQGRQERREAINALLHNKLHRRDISKAEELFYNEYGQGDFANLFRKDGNLRRRAFRNQDFLNTIASREYSTNDVYRPSTNKTLGNAAGVIAENINNIINPTLIRKTANGRFVKTQKEYQVPVTDLVRKTIYRSGCRGVNCGKTLLLPKTYMETRHRDGHRWEKAQYDNINSSVQSRDIYGQKPEMADFHALPAELQTTTSTENRTLRQSTPATTTRSTTSTSTPGSSGTVALKRRTGNGQNPVTKTTTKGSVIPGNTVKRTKTTISPSQTTSTNQTREITTTTLPDGTVVNTSYGDWTDVK